MFILDLDKVKSAMYTKCVKVEISNCGTRESTTSIFNGFKGCNQRESPSYFWPLSLNQSTNFVKHVNSANNTDFPFARRAM